MDLLVIRVFGFVALLAACFLGACFLILVSLVFAGPVATVGALLALTGAAAWRGGDRGHRETREPTPGRERLEL